MPVDPDAVFMKKALSLAARGAGRTSPNPLVGAVVVKGDSIVGRGWHDVLGGPHAEVNALADAGGNASGAALYVTLEPCNHQGLTPPCTKAVIEAGISRVVFAMTDPNPGVAGGGAEFLLRRGIEVKGGVLERECRGINQPFIKYVTTGMPFVRLKAAATLDGFIAARSGDSKWISNETSRRLAHRLRLISDGVLVGIGTVLADDPMLTVRLRGGTLRQPVRIVLDSGLKLPVRSQLARSAGASPVWVICGEDASAEKERALSAAGVDVIRTAGRENGLPLGAILKELGKRRISSVLVEGGGRVLGSFLESGFADEFYFFYAPKILGDRGGVGMLQGGPRLSIADSVPVYGLGVKNVRGDLLVSGRFRESIY
ncbi:MAG: bifunctional diaminohydroxyphosphoribosylaminopyrimidine deaminase/5-amino-6-(5-phosphoribosylamino)uracil reductase RibD [Desulfobacteraceae bacterium]|nr:bifunctional diaminohydroxyphosphoribosylaminopyrimidine deaminase/5-amino-6-(5-phosphoribosylamino)uracil reductase RibD [Desulfobacteraceae bacterium]